MRDPGKKGSIVTAKVVLSPGPAAPPPEQARQQRPEEMHTVQLTGNPVNRLLVISFFDGIGAIWMALKCTPFTVVGFAFENDPECIAVVSKKHPAVVHCGGVESFGRDWLLQVLHDSKPDAILLAGGPPCKQLSRLGQHWLGLQGKDSGLFWVQAEASAVVEEVASGASLPWFHLLENVVMPKDAQHSISSVVKSDPILINSAFCGWHQRRRLIWASWKMEGWLDQLEWDPKEQWLAWTVPRAERALPGLAEVFKSDFWPTDLKRLAKPEFPEGRFETISCPLRKGMVPHGWAEASAGARTRCAQDSDSYPYYHYEQGNLLWRGEEWRTVNIEEKERLFGYPTGYTNVKLPSGKRLDLAARHRMLGNTWHIPNFTMMMLSLAAVCGHAAPASEVARVWAAPPPPLMVPTSRFDPVGHCWGKTGREFVDAYIACVPPPLGDLAIQHLHLFDPPDSEWNPFYQDLLRQGLLQGGLFLPDHREHSAHGSWAAAASSQRGFDLSRHGWPRVLESGLSALEHWQQAHEITQHPFDRDVRLGQDLEFTCHSLETTGDMVVLRRKAMAHFRSKSKQLSVLQQACVCAMAPRVKAVSATLNVSMALYFSVLLAHPDVTYAARLVTGFQTVGTVETAPVFRSNPPDPDSITRAELLKDAEAYIDKLEASLVPSEDPAMDTKLLELSKADLLRGGASGFYSRQAMNARYGVGGWRPLRRFCILQPHNGKYRAIDDGKYSGHNLCAPSGCRVHTTSHDLVVAVCRRLFQGRELIARANVRHGISSPEGLQLLAGLDDETSAYRYKPTSPLDSNFLIIGLYHPLDKGPRYMELYGHPFGLSSAVLNYNRGPELQTAAMRQLLRVPFLHYYDDGLILGLRHEKASGQESYGNLCKLLGVKLDVEKRHNMSDKVNFTGAEFTLDKVFSEGRLGLAPKEGRREAILQMIGAHEDSQRMSAAEASTLRGKCGYMSNQLVGKLLRVVDGPLIHRHTATPLWA